MENQGKVVAVATQKQEVAKAIAKTNIADSILRSFNELVGQEQLRVPAGYSMGNELKLAYLAIVQKPELRTCTDASIGRALSEMVIQGLQISRNQCYFIKFGNECHLFRSYFGDTAVALRTGLVKDIRASVVHQGDEFEVDIVDDEEAVAKHRARFENHDKPIVAAYAVAILPDGRKRYCVMSKAEIDRSWSKAKNAGQTQREFGQEMSKRTVIRRLVKMLFNSANTEDNYLSAVVGSYNRTTADEYEDFAATDQAAPAKTTVGNTIAGLIEEQEGDADEAPEETGKEEGAEGRQADESSPADKAEDDVGTLPF